MSATEPTKVTLQEITFETVQTVINLEVAEDQRRYVAPNAHSIAEAHFSDKAWFRAIYTGETPVGFVMLYIDPEEPKYFLWRLMVDQDHQKKGVGFQAMQQVIEYVRTLPGASLLETSYQPGNGDPSGFYYKLGFVETGELLEGEKVLRLRL